MDDAWTLSELAREAAVRIRELPAPKNGQVRAVPDERTIRYYGTLGLLDRPAAMRGRTALYGRKHLAQVIAIKRLQHAGKSLADIQHAWSALDDTTLARMSGVVMPASAPAVARPADFWKRAPHATTPVAPEDHAPAPAAPVELRIELAPDVMLTLALDDERAAISPADVRALRAAAAPLLAELARRNLTLHDGGPR